MPPLPQRDMPIRETPAGTTQLEMEQGLEKVALKPPKITAAVALGDDVIDAVVLAVDVEDAVMLGVV